MKFLSKFFPPAVAVAIAACVAAAHASVIRPEPISPDLGTVIADTRRSLDTTTTLADGRMLVAGGVDARRVATAAVKVLNPDTGETTPEPSMLTPRALHAAVLLSDGRVMVSGGQARGRKVLASVEIFEPESGTWMPATPMNIPREAHAATLLPSGKVMVTGGYNGSDGGSGLASVEIYDPIDDRWTPAAEMNVPRFLHTSTRLASGRVMVAAGGVRAPVRSSIGSIETYDAVRNRWTLLPETIAPREGHSDRLLPSGRVRLLAGYHIRLAGPDDSRRRRAASRRRRVLQPLARQLLHHRGSRRAGCRWPAEALAPRGR